MARGRRAKPAEIKQLMGNPGKRRLALEQRDGKGTSAPADKSPRKMKVEPPAFLTQEQEKQFFKQVLQWLPPNLVRRSDTMALARWASWLHIWVTCKLALDGKAHWYTTESKYGADGSNGVKIHREHPMSKLMGKCEAHLASLEDRLCLNIVARNNVIHKILHAPAAHAGGLFGDELPTEDEKKGDETPTLPGNAPVDTDPLGFVNRASKPH